LERSVLSDPKERMVNHLVALKRYAESVLAQGEVLTPWEEADKAARMDDFFEVGISFQCTDGELVSVIIRDTFQGK